MPDMLAKPGSRAHLRPGRVNVKARGGLRVLFVAFADSIHTARWTAQLAGLGWDLHVFAVTHKAPCPELQGVTVHRLVESPGSRSAAPQQAIYWPLRRGETRVVDWLERAQYYSPAARLVRAIESLQPDVVHSLEMQNGAYLTLEARRRMGAAFPVWIYSSWGSDLYHFGQRPEHTPRIREVLGHCDYMFADCQRDVRLARQYGFAGELLGVYPVGGGFDLPRLREMRQPGSVSSRRVIAVKGYQGGPFEARGVSAIEALRKCASQLADYEIVAYSAAPEVRTALTKLARDFGVRTSVLPASHHQEVLRLMGRARVSLGLGLSDGTPNTMLESMIMGAFPIQSDTLSTREWITNGVNGQMVPPDSPEEIAGALARALADDALVEQAAQDNARLADERLGRERIRGEVVSLYERAAKSRALP